MAPLERRSFLPPLQWHHLRAPETASFLLIQQTVTGYQKGSSRGHLKLPQQLEGGGGIVNSGLLPPLCTIGDSMLTLQRGYVWLPEWTRLFSSRLRGDLHCREVGGTSHITWWVVTNDCMWLIGLALHTFDLRLVALDVIVVDEPLYRLYPKSVDAVLDPLCTPCLSARLSPMTPNPDFLSATEVTKRGTSGITPPHLHLPTPHTTTPIYTPTSTHPLTFLL